MFKRASLSAKLYMGFAAVLVIAGALGIFAFTRLVKIKEDAHEITADYLPGIFLAEEIKEKAMENLVLTAMHILAKTNPGKDHVETDMAKVNGEIDKLLKEYEAIISNAGDREIFSKVSPAREKFLAVRNQVLLPISRQHKEEEAVSVLKDQLTPAFEGLLAAAQGIVNYNKVHGDEAGVSITTDVNAAKTGILVGLLTALALGAAIGTLLSKSITSALNQVISSLSMGSEQVSAASNQVSQSSQQMAEGASEQASSLEETSASLEEMSSMTRQNSENARQADVMATETRLKVEKGREAMTRMGDAIGRIKGSSDQTARIIKTIDEIAFQTNLLALNAAVEAARAGDAGKGFAVVAEEVRNLAQRSAEAARNTTALIQESQQNANDGVAVSNEVGGLLTGIVDSVQKLSQLIGEVSSASQEQTKGIEQIGTAVTEMDKATQANAASAEESASASEEMFAQAKELKEMVTVLVGILKGSSAAASGRSSTGSPAVHGAIPRSNRRSAPAKAGEKRASAGRDWSMGASTVNTAA